MQGAFWDVMDSERGRNTSDGQSLYEAFDADLVGFVQRTEATLAMPHGDAQAGGAATTSTGEPLTTYWAEAWRAFGDTLHLRADTGVG